MTNFELTMPFRPFQPTAHNFINWTGRKNNRLTVFSLYGRNDSGCVFWLCRCSCGVWKTISANELALGRTKSCGCWRDELLANRTRTHGATVNGVASPEYTAFARAIDRCNNPRNKRFERYGKRGIKFLFSSFEEFYAKLGNRPTSKHSLDRFPDPNGHYEPSNVRWATPQEQQRNKECLPTYEINGQQRLMCELAEESPIQYSTIRKRIYSGWCIVCAVTRPLKSKCPHK